MPYAIRRAYRRHYRQPCPRPRQQRIGGGKRIARHNRQRARRRDQERGRLRGGAALRNNGWPLGAPGRVLLL